MRQSAPAQPRIAPTFGSLPPTPGIQGPIEGVSSSCSEVRTSCNRAYLPKESFREFWKYKSKGWARRFVTKWFWWATHSRLRPMRDFAWMLRRRQDDILNYFALPIDNGTVEGMNNKDKVFTHRCYGFRTAATHITALYHCLGKLPEPELVQKFL